MAAERRVTLNDVSLAYGAHAVLEAVSLELRRGEVLGVLGRVGAGKTRLLRLIAGLERAQRGSIDMHGNARLSYAFQDAMLVPWLSVRDNLRLVCRGDAATASAAIERLGRIVPVAEMLPRRPHELSGGMRQQINFVRAFLNDDDLVLLDEPFASLDPGQKLALQRAFLTLHAPRRPTVVIVTHDVVEALAVCDRLALLSSHTHAIVDTIDNPYRGRLDVDVLLDDPGYRQLWRRARQFYDLPGGEA